MTNSDKFSQYRSRCGYKTRFLQLKKIILVAIMFLLFAGVVSASSINGDYKGNPIVKITSNGKALEVDEVPPMIYDGHTVVPISLLRQLGASVVWDQNTYGVDVTFSSDAEKMKYYSLLSDRYSQLRLVGRQLEYNSLNFNLTSLLLKMNSNPDSNLKSSEDSLNQVITMYNKIQGTTALFIQNNTKYGESIDDMNSGLINYYNSIDSFKAAMNNLFAYSTDTNYGSKFLENANKALQELAAGNKIMEDGYNKYYFKLQEIGVGVGVVNNATKNTEKTENPLPPTEDTNTTYSLNDAIQELGFQSNTQITVSARDLAIELLEIRKTKRKSDYSVQDALRDLGIPSGSTPTLSTLKQAIKLISIH
jgi:hypothetical protein